MNKNDLKKWLIKTGREIRETRQAFKNAQRQSNWQELGSLRIKLAELRFQYTKRHRLYSLSNGKTPKQIEKAGFKYDSTPPWDYSFNINAKIVEEYGLNLDLKAVENV